MAPTEAKHHGHEHTRLATTAQQAKYAAIVQTFAKRARNAALAAGETQEAAEASATTAVEDAETTFEETAIQE